MFRRNKRNENKTENQFFWVKKSPFHRGARILVRWSPGVTERFSMEIIVIRRDSL